MMRRCHAVRSVCRNKSSSREPSLVRRNTNAYYAVSLRRAATTATTPNANGPGSSFFRRVWGRVCERPVEYASIPCVAAFVGIMTNYMGVKMLFYPIEYVGIDGARWPDTPYGLVGWQGVVPCKTKKMAGRLVVIVTDRLLSLPEAFGRLDPSELAIHLLGPVEDSIRRECGPTYAKLLHPVLPHLLPYLLTKLQTEIDDILDLKTLVMDSFVRDKVVLVDLFQKVGRNELEFLVNSGFGFGFGLGLGQMAAWAAYPNAFWTLPVFGAVVGYVTNWIAIKLLFEPAEPIYIANTIRIQGLFESRQVEVSDEFGDFMQKRVLNSPSLLQALSQKGDDGELHAFLRRELPYPIPERIVSAAVKAIAKVANDPLHNAPLHAYVTKQLDIRETLASRLKLLSPTDFEDLLHPVFQEDEMTLIATGGVLGLVAGGLQTKLGWGGPGATLKASITIAGTLLSSAFLYLYEKQEEKKDPPLASRARPHLRRRATIVLPVEENQDAFDAAYR